MEARLERTWVSKNGRVPGLRHWRVEGGDEVVCGVHGEAGIGRRGRVE